MNDGILDTSDYVRVMNNTGMDIKGMYDGKAYLFKVGAPTDIHVMAARHIFCFGVEDKTPCFHRMGWLEGRSYEQAMDMINAISFEEVTLSVPDISPKKRTKISKPTPLVNAGVDDGEEDSSSSPSEATGTFGDL
jgi:hypothetical protein